MPKITGENKPKRKGVMSQEDFKKLPKDEQEKILAKRAEAKKQLVAEAEEIDLDDMIEDTSSPSEREFNSKFNKAYETSRKISVALMKKKRAGLLTGKALWEATQEKMAKIFEFDTVETEEN